MTKAVLFSAVFLSAIGIAAPAKRAVVAANSTSPSGEGSSKLEAPGARPGTSRGMTPASTTVDGGTPATLSTSANPPSASKIYGLVETRPSYYYGSGSRWGTENTAELGWMPNGDRLFSYTQYFNTNLYDPSKPGADAGVVVQDGFFRYKMKNIWNSSDRSWSLTYDPRIYLPTDPILRSHGLYGYTRQYLTLSKKLADNLTLSFIELPFVYGYDRAGYKDSKGVDQANPIVENREYIVLDASFFNGFVDVSLPLLINHQLGRKFGTAKNSDRWSHVVWTWPEIDFNVAPHLTVGVSWESDNFIKDDFSGFDISHGFEQGEAQFVLRATL